MVACCSVVPCQDSFQTDYPKKCDSSADFSLDHILALYNKSQFFKASTEDKLLTLEAHTSLLIIDIQAWKI